MSLHRITLSSSYEAKLPWRKYPGRLVSRSELVRLADKANSAADPHNEETLEEVLAFAEALIKLFDGEVVESLLAAEVPSGGEALTMQPVPIVRTNSGLYGVVQQDTIASLRSSLPKGRFNELRQLLSDWFLDSHARLI